MDILTQDVASYHDLRDLWEPMELVHRLEWDDDERIDNVVTHQAGKAQGNFVGILHPRLTKHYFVPKAIAEMPANKAGEAVPAPEDNLKPLDYREQFQGRHVTSQFIDPCLAASQASMDCMNRHDYDRDFCLDYFQAYRDCKKTWIEQRKADRRAGRPTK